MATIHHLAANCLALNEPALHCTFSASLATIMSSLYPDVTHVIKYPIKITTASNVSTSDRPWLVCMLVLKTILATDSQVLDEGVCWC